MTAHNGLGHLFVNYSLDALKHVKKGEQRKALTDT